LPSLIGNVGAFGFGSFKFADVEAAITDVEGGSIEVCMDEPSGGGRIVLSNIGCGGSSSSSSGTEDDVNGDDIDIDAL
jgi:hypothetical protein